MDDPSYSRSWAYNFGCYEELKVLDDMNSSRFYELSPLDAMNTSELRMIWTILGRKPMALNDMNSLRLWMTWMTPGSELKVLDAMNNLGLWLTRTTLDRELNALHAMNRSRLLVRWMTPVVKWGLLMLWKIETTNDMNDWGSWAQGSRCHEKVRA